MSICIREERHGDAAAIEKITVAAFQSATHSSGTEHHIVNALRRASALTVSLVAEADGVVVGHVAVSPITVSDGSQRWFGLGPLSVLPAQQRRGLGSSLMQAALEELRGRDAAGCVLLGDPAYYHRFGFSPVPGLVLPGVPPEYFQAIVLGPRAAQGIVSYHPAFGAPGPSPQPSPGGRGSRE